MIQDPNFEILAEISRELEKKYPSEDAAWKDSPFSWIRTRPSRQVGAIGEELVTRWLEALRIPVICCGDAHADRIIQGKRVEIKFSTLWGDGRYKFQQIRDQHYDLVICLGVSPFSAHCWVLPKEDIIRLWKEEHKIMSQHGGQGGVDTAWIIVDPENPPEWLKPYGGSLAVAISVLRKITDFQ